MDSMKKFFANILAPVSTAIGVTTGLCQGTDLGHIFPEAAPYCGLLASVSLLFSRFK